LQKRIVPQASGAGTGVGKQKLRANGGQKKRTALAMRFFISASDA
jgi:hypothetical protein